MRNVFNSSHNSRQSFNVNHEDEQD